MTKWAMVVLQQALAVSAGYAAMVGTLDRVWAFVVILQSCSVILGLLVAEQLLETLPQRQEATVKSGITLPHVV